MQCMINKRIKELRMKILLDKLRRLPQIRAKQEKDLLKKYLDRWYENGYLIPNEAAERIQAAFRGYLFRKQGEKDKILVELLIKLIGKYGISDSQKKWATLMKWSKNTRLLKCEEDANIIQNFCRNHSFLIFCKSKH